MLFDLLLSDLLLSDLHDLDTFVVDLDLDLDFSVFVDFFDVDALLDLGLVVLF